MARANWDIVEVRRVDGSLLWRHEIAEQGEFLLHARMAFVQDRFLVLEVGGGVMASGCRVWDFARETWGPAWLDHPDDVSLVGVDAARGRLALSDGGGVDVLDVQTGDVQWRLPLFSPSQVSFGAGDTVAASGDAWLLGDSGDPGTLAVFERDGLRSTVTASRELLGVGWWNDALVSLDAAGELTLRRDAGARGLRSLGEGEWQLVDVGPVPIAFDGTRSVLVDGAEAHEGLAMGGLVPGGVVWATDIAAGVC